MTPVRRERNPFHERMAEILAYLRAHADDDAACTTVAIADHFKVTRQHTLQLCLKLASAGHIHGARKTPRGMMIWHLGKPARVIAAKKSASISVPSRKVLSTWEPHHCRDEMTAALFGPGRIA